MKKYAYQLKIGDHILCIGDHGFGWSPITSIDKASDYFEIRTAEGDTLAYHKNTLVRVAA